MTGNSVAYFLTADSARPYKIVDAWIALCLHCISELGGKFSFWGDRNLNLLFIHTLSRDLSRLLVIPFNLPKLGGESEEDCKNFQKLGNLKKAASSCIGWAISLGKKFEEGRISKINGVMLPMIHPQLKGLDPRFITGYSILLYFANEVSAVQFFMLMRERCNVQTYTHVHS